MKALLISLAAAALTFTVSPAPAQSPPSQVVVSYADLDLSTASGVRKLDRRLRSAVPETRVIVLRPLALDVDVQRSSTRMHEAGADIVVATAKDAVEAIERLLAEATAPRAGSALAAVN